MITWGGPPPRGALGTSPREALAWPGVYRKFQRVCTLSPPLSACKPGRVWVIKISQ
jgi:hypothetical protein